MMAMETKKNLDVYVSVNIAGCYMCGKGVAKLRAVNKNLAVESKKDQIFEVLIEVQRDSDAQYILGGKNLVQELDLKVYDKGDNEDPRGSQERSEFLSMCVCQIELCVSAIDLHIMREYPIYQELRRT